MSGFSTDGGAVLISMTAVGFLFTIGLMGVLFTTDVSNSSTSRINDS
jgi:hypothetical protein